MDSNDILSHIIEIKTQMAKHEEADNALRADVRRVLDMHEHSTQRLGALERDATKIKTSIKIFQWIAGIVVAVSVGLIKAFRS